MTGGVSRLTAITRGLTTKRAILSGAIALVVVVVGVTASVAAAFGAQEAQRQELLAEVSTSAAALETRVASVSAAGVQFEADASAAAELSAELSATLALPPQRFDAAARSEIERALTQLTNVSSPLSGANVTIVMVRDEATLDELRSAEQSLADASGDLDESADEIESRRSELADAMEAARSAAKTLVDGVIGGTEGILAANTAASAESSDRVRTIVAALGAGWSADGLRGWVDAVAALEASSAEAAARLAQEEAERGVAESSGEGSSGGGPITGALYQFTPERVIPGFPPTTMPSATPPDTWPFIWNEYWRPYEECAGNMGLVATYPADNLAYGIDSGMSSPWTHSWGAGGPAVYRCG